MDGVGTWTQTIIIAMHGSGLDRMQCRCKGAGVARTFGAQNAQTFAAIRSLPSFKVRTSLSV